jgi:hypothetical protein
MIAQQPYVRGRARLLHGRRELGGNSRDDQDCGRGSNCRDSDW